jgi:hypothetical protein
MKSIKIAKKESEVDRQLITKFGEAVYSYSEVEAVFIRVEFKDGSSISYKRDESEDKIETLLDDSLDE